MNRAIIAVFLVFIVCSSLTVSNLYKPYRHVPPHRVAPPRSVFAPFWSEHGYTLMVWFSRKLRVCMDVFIHRISSEWIRKKEKCASSKWILRNLFCWRYNPRRLATTQPHEFLSENGYRFQRPGLKTSVEIDIIWSEIGSWFGGLGSTPHPHKNSQEYPPTHSLHLFINTMRIVQITVWKVIYFVF